MDSMIPINVAWIAVCAGLVMFMQAGFCLLESGMARTKNSINVAIKNLIDLCISGMLYWAFGFAFMFGSSYGGWIGIDGFGLSGYQTPSALLFFLFQFVFCGTATTIISGATAERMSFRGYIIVAAMVGGFVYPVMGHWAWGGALGGTPGWLAEMGFVDFAGSTVVHSVGGWVSLAAIIVIGPRLGRFPKTSRRHNQCNQWSMPGHDLGMATVGVFVLWFGWFGFNGGSTLAIDDRVPLILVNTNLAAAAGGITALAVTWIHEGKPSVSPLLVGVVAGLVSITAGCHIVTPWSAIVIGSIGAVIACGSMHILDKLRIDDVVGAVPAHAIAGVWGTLALALLAPATSLPTGDRWTQLGVQLTGVTVAFAWAFGGSIIVLYGLHRLIGLRATPKQERIGLNYSEHGASTATLDLAAEMNRHRIKRQFNRPVTTDRHTEAGEIGKAYNRVLEEVSREIARRDEAETRYRDIVQNALEGIFQTTPEGVFRSANPSLLEIYGDKSLSDLLARTADIAKNLYVDPNRRDEFKSLIASEGTVRDFRAQIRRADGSVLWISESARAVKDENGKLLYYEGTVVDITNRVDTEKLQRERDFAEAANEAKSQFLARMSHEMRTPLGGVINTLELITDDMPAAQRNRFISIAKQSALTLLNLINDVLDLSRIEAGKLDLEIIETDIAQVLQVATEMLYQVARKKGLRLATRIGPDLPSMVWVDGERLQQVIVNLIGNAIKFTPKGEVAVSVLVVDPKVAVIRSKSPSEIILRIEVGDTGIGIPEDRIEKIFEVFTQAEKSTTRRYGGSGLGLAICRQLIELMGGKIGAKPRQSGGTVFWLEVAVEPVEVAKNHDVFRFEGRQVCVFAPNHGETSAILDSLRAWHLVPTHFESVGAISTAVREKKFKVTDCELVLVDSELQDEWKHAISERQLRSLKNTSITWIGMPSDASEKTRYLDRPLRASGLLNDLLTTFSIQAPPTPSSRPTPTEVIGDGQKFLIVDDNEVNRMVASEMIKRLGFEAIAVESGRLAIQALEEGKIALVMMDCEMPEMDGFETTAKIRELHQANRLATPDKQPIAIVACTAQASDSDRQRCLDSGMDDYITKPIRREDLASAIRNVMRQEPPIHLEELLHRCGDDRSVAADVLHAFAKRCHEDVRKIEIAVNENAEETSAAAHRIKGAASTLAAHSLSHIAEEIEEMASAGKQHRKQRYAKNIQALEQEMSRCIRWIETTLESLK